MTIRRTFAAATLFLVCFAQAQPLKIGYVNVEKVMRESTRAHAAQLKLDQEFGARRRELQLIEARVRGAAEKLDKDFPSLSEEEKAEQSRQLGIMRRDLERRDRSFREDFDRWRDEENAVVREQIEKSTRSIFEREKFDLIVQDAAFGSGNVDITHRVIELLNTQK